MLSQGPPTPGPLADLEDACGEEATPLCEWVFDATGSELTARAADIFLGKPATILLIVVIAWLVNRLVRRGIRRFTDRIASPESTKRLSKLKRRAPAALVDTGSFSLRSAARAQTLALVLRSITSIVIWGLAAVLILGELGVALGPLIAGAGVAGVALGFGAQSLVKDFLTGIFMLIEDQYGVGDIIDAGDAIGTVEAITLRTTRLRDLNGTVWHIPNGTIARVGNMSQQWARALLDVSVAYGTDIGHAQEVIQSEADGLRRDPTWRGKVIEEPEVWGVDQLGADGIVIRLVVKTRPAEQWAVSRELRRRLADAFEREGIEIPFPQRAIWVRREAGSSREVDLFDEPADGPVETAAGEPAAG
ncbi:MAG TPA: mechanosensitive ion channel family protein [Acidimicrobiales bacterium]